MKRVHKLNANFHKVGHQYCSDFSACCAFGLSSIGDIAFTLIHGNLLNYAK